MPTTANVVIFVGAMTIAVATARADFMIGVDGSRDIEVIPKSASPTMTINIESGSGITELVVGWSLGLRVIPDAGATGKVEIATVTLPSNYLFDGRSQGLSTRAVLPTTDLMPIFDSDTQNGRMVPTVANLLALTFKATNAKGKFKILAVGNQFNGTNVTKLAGTNFPTVALDNVAFDSLYELGSITVVPEPSPFFLVGLIGIVVWLTGNKGVKYHFCASVHDRSR